MSLLKKFTAVTTTACLLGLGVIGLSTTASATDGGECTPSAGQEYIAPTYKDVPNPDYAPAIAEIPAVAAIPGKAAVPGAWSNFEPNKDQGDFSGPPSWPSDARGTWSAPKTDGGPQQDAVGVYQSGNGKGSWYHRDAGTPAVAEIPGKPAVPGVPAKGEPTMSVIDNPGQPAIDPVTCDDPELPPVDMPTAMPAPVNVDDLCGVDNDKYLVPEDTEEFSYARDGDAIVATLHEGFIFGQLPYGYTDNGNGTATYPFFESRFTDVPCEGTTEIAVTPVTPTPNDVCGTENDRLNLPENTEGITYSYRTYVPYPGAEPFTDYMIVIATLTDGYVWAMSPLFPEGWMGNMGGDMVDGAHNPAGWFADSWDFTDEPCGPGEPEIVNEWHTWQSPTWEPEDGLGWPQSYVDEGRIDPTMCETTYQQDEYRGTREQIDAVLEDGMLDQGEDYGIVVQGIVVSTPECEEVLIEVTPTLDWTTPTCDMGGELIGADQEGVMWSAVLNDDGSSTYTASPAEGYTFPEETQTQWLVPNLDQRPADECVQVFPVPTQFNAEPSPASCTSAGTFDIGSLGGEVVYDEDGFTVVLVENGEIDIDRTVEGEITLTVYADIPFTLDDLDESKWDIFLAEDGWAATRTIKLDAQLTGTACPTSTPPVVTPPVVTPPVVTPPVVTPPVVTPVVTPVVHVVATSPTSSTLASTGADDVSGLALATLSAILLGAGLTIARKRYSTR